MYFKDGKPNRYKEDVKLLLDNGMENFAKAFEHTNKGWQEIKQ